MQNEAELIINYKEKVLNNENLDQEKILVLIRQSLSRLTPQEERVLRLRFGINELSNNIEKFPSMQFQGVN